MKQTEYERLLRMMSYEIHLRKEGFNILCGIDEVGRGPLAGPVVASCVILADNCFIEGINDSKKLTALKREKLDVEIRKAALDISIGMVSQQEIDKINILNATKKAMIIAIGKLKMIPDYLLIDAIKLNTSYNELPIIKGDEKSVSIAASSIVAKVYRDSLMIEYDKIYPQYGFKSNKGYGTKKHIEAIKKFGPTPLHRKSFIKKFLSEKKDDAV